VAAEAGVGVALTLATVQRCGYWVDSAALTLWIGLPYRGGEGRNDRYGCHDPRPGITG
jgi:hypothetical protein